MAGFQVTINGRLWVTAEAEEAEQVLYNDPIVLQIQARKGEQRVLTVGETDHGRLLAVVFTVRGGMIRVVTAHPAKEKARRIYQAQKGH